MAKKKAKPPSPDAYSIHSQLIHGRSRDEHWDYRHHVVPPLSSSSTYRLEGASRGARGFAEFAQEQHDPEKRRKAPIYIYDRLAEPTRDMLEEALALSEQGQACVTFATGMAAIAAALGICVFSGHHIAAHRTIYGSTYSLMTQWFPKLKISTTFADFTRPGALERALRPTTRAIYLESPANPNLQLVDIAAARRAADAVNAKRRERDRIRIVVDNTFATPFCQRPLTLGADLVVHSLTKNICGFGTDMGGAAIGSYRDQSALLSYRKDFGGVLSPKGAWPILVHGVPTLSLRVRHQERTAHEVAGFLEQHPAIARVLYPGLPTFPQYELARRQMVDYDGNFAPGNMVYFIVKGPHAKARARAERLIDRLARDAYTITLAVSLGQVRTLVEHPSSMTHSSVPLDKQVKEGIDPGGVRISIGLEDPRDLIQDLRKALAGI
ncbi:MAG: PLP-dependent transferase [Planctomycetota bacterium]|nr:PLP-dependent transferase [Planctomycetota bacterium]